MIKVCSRCVMDNINNPDIKFDSKGNCNYCSDFILDVKDSSSNVFNNNLEGLMKDIKHSGKNKIWWS